MLKAVEQGTPIELAKLERSVTIDHAVTGISLKKAAELLDEDLIVSTIIALIIRTSSFLNISRPMTEDQATDTAYLLFEKYPFETLEDFVLMLKEGKSGKYGKNYNRLDGMIIFEWMEIYMDRKSAHREKLHRELKFSDNDLNIQQIVLKHEENQQQETGKPVLDALKTAIEFDKLNDHETNEMNYYEFRKKFIQKNSGNAKKSI